MSWLATITAKEKPQYGVSVLKSALAPLASPVSTNKPHVDTKKMCVTAVLTARSPDRQGDIVDPLGGNFGEHMTNPVVMFHHGKQHRLPIGKAEDADGNYTVRHYKAQEGDLLFGTTYFAQSNAFANDVFGLIAEDILRGVSIGFDPLYHKDAVEEIGDSPILDRPALHFKSWKLLEYSHTPIGVHPEALTAIVRKAEDGSRKMHPALVKVLQPFATPKRTTVAVTKGCENMPPAQQAAVAIAKNAAKPNGKLKAKPPVAAPKVTKAMPDEDEDDTGIGDPTDVGDAGDPADAGTDDPGAGASAQYDPSRDDPNDDPNLPANATFQTDEDSTPPTVRALLDGSQGLTDLATSLEEAMKKGEHPGGRKFCMSMCDNLRSLAKKMQAKAQGIHSELNGGMDASGDDEAEAGDVPAEGDPEDADNTGGGEDEDENAEEDASEPEEPPPTDDEGAVVTKGIEYSPRRFAFANSNIQDQADQVPRAITAAPPHKLKALEEENSDLKEQNAELAQMMEKLLEDVEAGKRRRE